MKSNKVPRKLKKAIKNQVLCIDLCSIPSNLHYGQFIETLHTTGMVIWDSRLGGESPKFMNRKSKRVRLVDISKK